MEVKFVFLWTDVLIYILLIAVFSLVIWTSRQEYWAEPWRRVGKRKLGMIAFIVLLAYSLVGFLDSIHLRFINKNQAVAERMVEQNVQSFLDIILRPLGQNNERTYSAPFSIYSSAKTVIEVNGVWKTIYSRLKFGGSYLQSPAQKTRDILLKSMFAVVISFILSGLFCGLIIFFLALKKSLSFNSMLKEIIKGKAIIAWREILLTCCLIFLIATYIKLLSPYYHLLGTDKIGGDILYETIKSIRTGLIIGTVTTLVMLPFAILLGAQAGYHGGWRDDIIQYIYTTLSSVPAVLLISAAVLSLQVFISNHPLLFPTLENRADARLLALCLILGITSWTSLCRLLRAETLKLREMDYVKASVAIGVNNLRVIWRHIIPNMLHIILITVVLDFSGLVLAEAVLSYVGVGVDPTTPSWGNIINSARLDLAREPMVWWPLVSAFIFMFGLVLSANLFADAIRDAFDPRLRN